MICFLCQNTIPDDAAQTHRCVKDNSALFSQRRAELSAVSPSEFTEYTDDIDFFDAVQIIDVVE